MEVDFNYEVSNYVSKADYLMDLILEVNDWSMMCDNEDRNIYYESKIKINNKELRIIIYEDVDYTVSIMNEHNELLELIINKDCMALNHPSVINYELKEELVKIPFNEGKLMHNNAFNEMNKLRDATREFSDNQVDSIINELKKQDYDSWNHGTDLSIKFDYQGIKLKAVLNESIIKINGKKKGVGGINLYVDFDDNHFTHSSEINNRRIWTDSYKNTSSLNNELRKFNAELRSDYDNKQRVNKALKKLNKKKKLINETKELLESL